MFSVFDSSLVDLLSISLVDSLAYRERRDVICREVHFSVKFLLCIIRGRTWGGQKSKSMG